MLYAKERVIAVEKKKDFNHCHTRQMILPHQQIFRTKMKLQEAKESATASKN
jgi:hypothetical protein